MTDNETLDYGSAAPRPRRIRAFLLVALIGILAGAALVAWAVTRWQPARELVSDAQGTSPLATAAALPPPSPVMTYGPAAAPLVTPESVSLTESRVAGLEARLAQIDIQAASASANAARAEGLLIAFAARRAIDRGSGLGYLEGQLRDRFANTQPRAVAAIISAAQAPVTIDALRQQLDVVAPRLAGGGPDESWRASAQRVLADLFIIRKTTEASPLADDRLSRARLALEGGQVDTALAEIARLPARDAAASWMTAARRYIEAHRALDILEAAALTAIPSMPLPSPTTGQPTP